MTAMTLRDKLIPLAIALYVFLGLVNSARCEVPFFLCQPIGNLGTSSGGTSFSTTNAVNNSGQVIGYSQSYPANVRQCVFWDHGQLTVISAPGANLSVGFLNNAGQAAGGAGYVEGNYGYVWSSGNFQRIDTIGTGTLPQNLTNWISFSTGINDAGQVAGATLKFTGGGYVTVPIVWQSGKITEIVPTADVGPAHGYFSNIPATINALGWVVGTFGGTLRSTGYVWHEGTFTPLDKIPRLLNDQGDMAGYWYDNPNNAIAWVSRNGMLETLAPISVDSLGQSQSFPAAMNNNAWITGGAWTFNGSGIYIGSQGVLWHDGKAFGFGPDPDGYLTSGASAINDRGQVMGYTGKHSPNPNDNLGRYGYFYDDGVTTFLRSPSISPDGHEYVSPSILTEDGEILGTYYVYVGNSIAEHQAFLWRMDLGTVPLDTLILGGLDHAYWDHLDSVTGISDNGLWITGIGITLGGNTEGFVLQLVPEPVNLALLAVGAMVLRRLRR